MNMNYNYPTTIFRSFFAQNVQTSGRKMYVFNFAFMNMNYNYPTTIFRSIFAQNVQISGRRMYVFNFASEFFRSN